MGELLRAILGGAVGAAFVTGVFGIIKWLLDRKAAKEDRKEDKETMLDKQRDSELEEIRGELSDLKVAIRAQMYADIKKAGKEYISRGSITAEELEALISAHQVYHNTLNGNGFLDSLMEKVKRLPVAK